MLPAAFDMRRKQNMAARSIKSNLLNATTLPDAMMTSRSSVHQHSHHQNSKLNYTARDSINNNASILLMNNTSSADNSQLLIPSRAIKVSMNRTQVVKKTEDFRNMKNLFLANCLKIKDGEHSLSQRAQKVMSNRIRANRGGEPKLDPI